jgi:hypothetical protein
MTIMGACIISTDTLRPEDLIPKFLGALEMLPAAAEAVSDLRAMYADLLAWFENSDRSYFDHIPEEHKDDAYWLMEALDDHLNEFAPAGTYFGSSDGDGACFGFWEFESE